MAEGDEEDSDDDRAPLLSTTSDIENDEGKSTTHTMQPATPNSPTDSILSGEDETLEASSMSSPRLFWLVLAMLLWRLGEQGWRFAVPLLLLDLAMRQDNNGTNNDNASTSKTLSMPAAYGMLTCLANVFLGPSVGALVDRQRSRIRPVLLAASVTSVAVALGGAAMCFLPLLMLNKDNQSLYDSSSNKQTLKLWLIVGIASLVGCIESLASMVAMVAISREWVPLLCSEASLKRQHQIKSTHEENDLLLEIGETDKEIKKVNEEKLLTKLNSAISTVNLLSETLSPLIAGALLTISYQLPLPWLPHEHSSVSAISLGTLVVVAFGVLMPLCAGSIIAFIHRSSSALKAPKKIESPAQTSDAKFNFFESWKTCFQHTYGIVFVVFSYSALYLSALSSHGILLTAFLKAEGVPPTILGGFRGAGALSGVLGVSIFPYIVSCSSLRSANVSYILTLVIGVSAATFAFFLGDSLFFKNDTTDISTTVLYIFMSMIVVSRAGLYGFETGLMQHQQMLVDEKHRSLIGAFENSACNTATILLYAYGIIVGKPSRFGDLIMTGMCAVVTSLILYCTWIYLWPEEEHSHLDDDVEGTPHSHTHTTQDESTMKGNGVHRHPVNRRSLSMVP